jgi:PAS domain S-box-containing protein
MQSLGALANAAGIALRNAKLWLTLRERSRQSQFAHHRAESQIKELKRYVDFFDSSADGILVVDRAGRLAFCNPAACHITGRDHESLRGTSFLDVLCEDGHQRFLQLRDRVKDGEAFGNEDLPIDLPNGQRRVLNVSVNNMLNAHGGLIVSFRDVTEDRAIARELTKTKEFLQCVIDSSVDAIVSADMNGTVRIFNPAAERIYGYEAHEVVGLRNVRSLYPQDRAFAIMEHIQSREYGGHGVLQGYETQLLGRAGEVIPVQLSASLILHRDRPIGSVGVFKDLRAKHQIEAQLAQTQEELQKQEKKTIIAELAGAAAHELNQPLTAVMGYADMLLRQIDHESRLGKIARSVMSETERMAEIVRKIGKLTKYETKAYVGDTKIIDIERSIDSEPPLDSPLTETYESSSRRPSEPTPSPNDC